MRLKERIIRFYDFEDHVFYHNIRIIAVPMVLQQIVHFSLQVLDNVMVGALGDAAIAAVALAGQVSFVMMIFVQALGSAATSFASQQWGREEIAGIRHTTGILLVSSMTTAMVFFCISQFIPELALRLFSKDELVIAQGIDYLRMVGWSYPIQALILSISNIMRSVERPKEAMAATCVGVATNGVLNYIFIFGKLGFRAMGVYGAALATTIAFGVNLLTLLWLTYRSECPVFLDKSPMFSGMNGYLKRFFQYAFPVFCNEALWSFAQMALIWIYAQLGTQMSAAIGIFNVIEQLYLVFVIAVSSSSVVLLGKEIGRKETQSAQHHAIIYLRLAVTAGILIAVFLNLAIGPVLLLYNASQVAKYIVRHCVLAMLIKLPFNAYNFIALVGVLRSGGDAKHAFFIDAGMHWLGTVSCVMLAAFVLQVPLQWVYAFTIPGDVVKFILGYRRVRSEKWIHTLQ